MKNSIIGINISIPLCNWNTMWCFYLVCSTLNYFINDGEEVEQVCTNQEMQSVSLYCEFCYITPSKINLGIKYFFSALYVSMLKVISVKVLVISDLALPVPWPVSTFAWYKYNRKCLINVRGSALGPARRQLCGDRGATTRHYSSVPCSCFTALELDLNSAGPEGGGKGGGHSV